MTETYSTYNETATTTGCDLAWAAHPLLSHEHYRTHKTISKELFGIPRETKISGINKLWLNSFVALCKQTVVKNNFKKKKLISFSTYHPAVLMGNMKYGLYPCLAQCRRYTFTHLCTCSEGWGRGAK